MQVRLEQEWTDSNGHTYAAGEMVDVDASTLARLQAAGFVSDPDGGGTDSWAGPTGGGTDSWAGPTGGES